ncbi:MAG: class I SAM-dependent methyltransferase [Bdellovibrionales bacterium]|nr:class I SAM-dependent methyltransferase [Bdellovibrionales bacterium]
MKFGTHILLALLVFCGGGFAGQPPADENPDRFVSASRLHPPDVVSSASEREIRTSLHCIEVTLGEAGWKNKHNKRFYNWLFRYAPFVLSEQREFCGLNGCQDLDFLRDFFRYNPKPHTRLVPDEFIVRNPDDEVVRNILLVGAHPREVEWLLANSSAGRIFAIDHSRGAVKMLKQTAEKQNWPADRVRIRKVSILHNDFERILAEMNDGNLPRLHFVFAMWSAFYEFNPSEQERLLSRAHDLLHSPGGLVIDFLSDPMRAAEPLGYRTVTINLEQLGLEPQLVTRLRASDPPPPLNVYIPGRQRFMEMVERAGFAAQSGFVDSQSPTFLYNEDRQPRALYLFERRD